MTLKEFIGFAYCALILIGEVCAQTPNYEVLNRSNGLPTNYVYRILESQEGYIWATTEKGVCRYDGLNIKCFDTNNGLTANDVYHFFEDEMSRIWLIGVSDVLSYIYQDSIYNFDNYKIPNIRHLWDGDSIQWFGSKDSIYKVDENHQIESFHLSETSSIEEEDFYPFFKYGYKYLPVSTTNVIEDSIVTHALKKEKIEFLKLKPDRRLSTKIIDQDFEYFEPVIQFNQPSQTFQIYENKLLSIYSKEMELLQQIPIAPFSGYYVNSALLDSKGNIWIATKKGLLVQYNFQRNQQVEFYENTQGQNITNLLNFGDDYIYTNDKEQIYINKDSTFYLLFEDEIGSRNNFYSVETIGSNIYFSSGNNGIRYLNSTSQKKYTIDINKYQLCEKYDFLLNKKFRIIKEKIFTISRGLLLIDPKNKKVCKLIDILIQDFVYDSESDLFWVISKDNVLIYQFDAHLENGSLVKNYPIKSSEFIYYCGEGKILVSNYAGQNFMCDQDSCIQLSYFDGEMIQAAESYKGFLYVSANSGLYEMSMFQEGVSEFNPILDYRVLGENIFVNDFIHYEDEIILGTNEGIVTFKGRIDPIEFELDEVLFRIDSIRGQKLDLSKDNKVSLSYENSYFELYYHSVIYSKIKDFSYEYMLDKVDEEIQSTQNRSVRYPSLAPGKYRFKIRAVNNDNYRSDWQEIKIKVEFPWWKKPWAYLFYMGFLGLIIWSLTKIFKRSVERESLFNQRLAESELMALQSQMNPHFLFNALNSIQNLIISNKSKEADLYLSKFANLMRRYLESSKHKFISLNEEMHIVRAYLDIEKLRFGDNLIYTIKNELAQKGESIKIPAAIIQPFVENALVHGLFNRKGDGHLDIIITESESEIEIKIIDDGVGRKKAKELNQAKGRVYKSRAIEIIENKIKVFKKAKGKKISYKIKDNSNNNNMGTVVIINIEI